MLAQIGGAELKPVHGEPVQGEPAAIPGWSDEKALRTLKVERIEFTNLDGNVQGYAGRARSEGRFEEAMRSPSARLRRSRTKLFSTNSPTLSLAIAPSKTFRKLGIRQPTDASSAGSRRSSRRSPRQNCRRLQNLAGREGQNKTAG